MPQHLAGACQPCELDDARASLTLDRYLYSIQKQKELAHPHFTLFFNFT
jgi:hypothetical protein